MQNMNCIFWHMAGTQIFVIFKSVINKKKNTMRMKGYKENSKRRLDLKEDQFYFDKKYCHKKKYPISVRTQQG